MSILFVGDIAIFLKPGTIQDHNGVIFTYLYKKGIRNSKQVSFAPVKFKSVRAVASLTVPGGQDLHFPHSFLKFRSIFLIFPQTFLILFLILTLWVGDSPTRKGPGYATEVSDLCVKGTNWPQKDIWDLPCIMQLLIWLHETTVIFWNSAR